MKENLISVIVNCYNGEKYILKTLQSIKKQRYKKCEVIFLDNCSTDDSDQIYKNINEKRYKNIKKIKK